MMYIINEKEYVRTLLTSNEKPSGISVGHLITLIAKYYFPDMSDAKSLSELVKENLSALQIYNYQEYAYHDKIISICEGLFSGNIPGSLKEREFVPIYMGEIKIINSLPNDRLKKLMFTLYAIARYMECDGWINKKNSKGISEVFRLANITVTCAKRNELLHELYRNGYISFGKKIDNLNIKVVLNDTDGIAYKISEFQNIGNQYLGNFKKGYKQCKKCGRVIKITGTNKQYCNTCSKETSSMNNIKRIKKCRENKIRNDFTESRNA